jgi:hypothetical protein
MDGAINPQDEMDLEHYGILVENCDTNNDGTLDSCEIHECIVKCENAWRDENCPEYGHVYCNCPFLPPTCVGAWNCLDVLDEVAYYMENYDVNGDLQINLGDDIEPGMMDEINAYCD